MQVYDSGGRSHKVKAPPAEEVIASHQTGFGLGEDNEAENESL
jgi:hypothetical protein